MQKVKFDKNIDLLTIDNGTPKVSLKCILTAEDCIYLKNRFNFLHLSEVILLASIRKISVDSWELTGNLIAQVIQSCVVTGEPVKEKLDISLEERYILRNDSMPLITDINVAASDEEVLETSILNIGELVAQIVGLEANPFPKIKNTPECYFFGSEDIKDNPFAKLANLKK